MQSTRALVLSALLAVTSRTNEAFQTGNAHYARGELEEAREAYNECLREQPDRTDCATNLASVLIDLGPQHEAFAEALYRRVLATDETHAAEAHTAFNLGLVDAAFNLAMMLQDRKTDEATREAATLYQRVVAADPQLWDAWSNLASALTELKVPVQAVHASQRAIVLLEQAQQAAGGATDDGADTMLGKLYFLLAMALVDLTAEQCADVASSPEALLVGVDELGGTEQSTAVCHENALNALRTSLNLRPDEPQAEHMLEALASEQGGAEGASRLQRASPQFVRSLFDDFSDTFEEKLEALQYQVPQLIGEMVALLASLRGAPYANALDAGCGTGLAGPLLRLHVSGALVGVDLSEKMLERAATLRTPTSDAAAAATGEVPVYSRLLAADLLSLRREALLPGTTAEAAAIDLVAAADVLVYFGELGALLQAFASVTAEGGDLVFSCEPASPDEAPHGWRIRASGRFAHTKPYVLQAAAAAGYTLLSYREITPRFENGAAVQGHMFALRLTESWR